MHGGLPVSDQDENFTGSIATWGVLAKKSFDCVDPPTPSVLHPRRKDRLSATVRNIHRHKDRAEFRGESPRQAIPAA
jgi:hypothetical protein